MSNSQKRTKLSHDDTSQFSKHVVRQHENNNLVGHVVQGAVPLAKVTRTLQRTGSGEQRTKKCIVIGAIVKTVQECQASANTSWPELANLLLPYAGDVCPQVQHAAFGALAGMTTGVQYKSRSLTNKYVDAYWCRQNMACHFF